jgi:hypothetical protein
MGDEALCEYSASHVFSLIYLGTLLIALMHGTSYSDTIYARKAVCLVGSVAARLPGQEAILVRDTTTVNDFLDMFTYKSPILPFV